MFNKELYTTECVVDKHLKGNSNYIYLLDPGHGDRYHTPNSKQAHHSFGSIYEGEFNRAVCHQIKLSLLSMDIDFIDIIRTNRDLELHRRIERANWCESKHYNTIFISIHGNAFHNPEPSGYEVFSSRGETDSDEIASVFNFHAQGLPFKNRGVKEANFYVLRNTTMPAVLTENGFMTNPDDCRFMLSEEGVKEIADAHVSAIEDIEISTKI